MNLKSIDQLIFRISLLCFSVFSVLAISSCSREDAQPVASKAVRGDWTWRVEKCMENDELWVDRLLHVASEGIKAGKTGDVLSRLRLISAAIDKVELVEDGVDCTEPVLIEREKIIEKLIRLAETSNTDINLIRFVSVEEKRGFVRAMIILLEDHQDRKAKAR